MTVTQLMAALADMPAQAMVLIEGDAGYSRVGGLDVTRNGGAVPDEVILLPSMDGN